ncbi:aminoglycoside phosphotransferase family protein [Streptomyces sp. NPDC055400]
MWEVISRTGCHFVKVAPEPVFYTCETRAYRAAVPRLGYANAPVLKESSAELLALILTPVEGEPLKSVTPPARRRAAHAQAGRLLRLFHDALPNHQAQAEAAHAVDATVTGLEKHITAAGDLLSVSEADMIRRIVSTLPALSPLPAGFLHGDFWERNLLWNGRRCALTDYERSTPGPLAADFVHLATAVWLDQPDLATALFAGYGRTLFAVEQQALAAFVAADAARALAYGSRCGDTDATARGRRTVERLAMESRR